MVVPGVVGIDHSRLVDVRWAISFPGTQPYWRVNRFRQFRGIEATVSAYRPNHIRPSPRTLAGVCDYPGRVHCLPRRALISELLTSKSRGMGVLSYDRQQVLALHAHIAPRGARSRRRSG